MALVWDVCMSYLLQLTFTENPARAGNATVNKTWSKHPIRGSGCVIENLNITLRAGKKSLQGTYGNIRDDFLGGMPLPSCVTLGKIFKLSVLQFSHL